MTLKQIRQKLKLTQFEAAKLLNVSRRSYQSYENDKKYQGTMKYEYFLGKLTAMLEDENQGILTLDDIRRGCELVFSNYEIEFCYLFGSYAKGKARQDSDIDLLVSTKLTGLNFFGMVEELRQTLHKKVDVLDLKQLDGNMKLINEILMDGLKIYG